VIIIVGRGPPINVQAIDCRLSYDGVIRRSRSASRAKNIQRGLLITSICHRLQAGLGVVRRQRRRAQLFH
jgi:hypothetical protein